MSNKVYVIGHKNPDSDSICAAIAYAYLKSKLTGEEYVAARAGELNREIEFVMEYFQVTPPVLVKKVEAGQALILVDHNEKGQAVDGLDDAELVEIIDHHRIADIQTAGPIYFRNQPLGSTSTIVALMYQENGVELPREIAGVLCSAILSDTLIFKSPTCTETDRAVAAKLAQIAGIDVNLYGHDMLKAGAKMLDKKDEEIFYQDYKLFDVHGLKMGIGQVNAMDEEEIKILKERMLKYMSGVCEEKGLDEVLLMVTNVLDEATHLLYVGKSGELICNAFGADINQREVYLPGVVSRKKQIVPVLMK